MRNAERDNARKRELYAERKLSGRCTTCGCELLPEWGAMCPECLEAAKARHRKYAKTRRAKRLNRKYRKEARRRDPEKFRAKSREYRFKKKEAGICARCTEPAEDGNTCAYHREYDRVHQTAYLKRVYAERTEAGTCLRCGGERDTQFMVCARCSEINNRASRKRVKKKRQQWLRLGLCGKCGSIKPEGVAHCDRCRVANAANKKRKADERRAAGLCTRCGAAGLQGKKTQCDACLEKVRICRDKRLAKIAQRKEAA